MCLVCPRQKKIKNKNKNKGGPPIFVRAAGSWQLAAGVMFMCCVLRSYELEDVFLRCVRTGGRIPHCTQCITTESVWHWAGKAETEG